MVTVTDDISNDGLGCQAFTATTGTFLFLYQIFSEDDLSFSNAVAGVEVVEEGGSGSGRFIFGRPRT